MISKQPKELSGVLVALITPFTDDGSAIDEVRLQSHINHMIDSGVHGLVPGGSTGEFTTLNTAERKQLIELCVKYADGRAPVVAGVGTLSTKECLDLASHAAQAGADAVMVVPPFYDALSIPQLHELFSEISSASNLPMMYYNLPSASGLQLTPRHLADLSSVGGKYVEDTSGDAPALTELPFSLHDEITCFDGWDTLPFYGLAAGAKGSVWGATNVIPELSSQLWDAVAVKGDLEKGRELWSKIYPICKFLESYSYSGAVKTGLELQGIKTGGLRKPFGLLDDEPTEEFRKLLQAAGVKTV